METSRPSVLVSLTAFEPTDRFIRNLVWKAYHFKNYVYNCHMLFIIRIHMTFPGYHSGEH